MSVKLIKSEDSTGHAVNTRNSSTNGAAKPQAGEAAASAQGRGAAHPRGVAA